MTPERTWTAKTDGWRHGCAAANEVDALALSLLALHLTANPNAAEEPREGRTALTVTADDGDGRAEIEIVRDTRLGIVAAVCDYPEAPASAHEVPLEHAAAWNALRAWRLFSEPLETLRGWDGARAAGGPDRAFPKTPQPDERSTAPGRERRRNP